jgi:hypothetical protein
MTLFPQHGYYGKGDRLFTDRLAYRQQTPQSELIWTVGENFDAFDFSQPSISFKDAI